MRVGAEIKARDAAVNSALTSTVQTRAFWGKHEKRDFEADRSSPEDDLNE